jgi:hypothetical protein
MSDEQPRDYKHLFVILGVVLLGAVGWYTYKTLFDRYEIKPERIFEEEFEENVAHVSNLTGGGRISGDFDVWLHFKLAGRAADLKQKGEFKPNEQDKEFARRWFYEKAPDPSIDNTQYKYLKYLQRTDNRSQSVDQEWFLYNWKTDDQYYRKWGY